MKKKQEQRYKIELVDGEFYILDRDTVVGRIAGESLTDQERQALVGDNRIPVREGSTTLYVYQWSHIDTFEWIFRPQVYGGDWQPEIERARIAFLASGWEGDGEIGVIWLPPFVVDGDDTVGRLIWHVKQSNNGISFLCSERPIYLEQLNEQNPDGPHVVEVMRRPAVR
jgi:hypothetical protein